MIRIRATDLLRAAAYPAVAMALVLVANTGIACETAPDLRIEVTSRFDTVAVRSDYALADIAALARRQQQRDTGRLLLGFYASEFGYTIDLAPKGDPACPMLVETVVTLRLQHRLIEIGEEAAANSCVYPSALRHYRRLAEVDEQTVEHFSARAAAMLAAASPALRQTHAPVGTDPDAALRAQVRAVVDATVAPLPDARRTAQQAVNDAGDLRRLASSCSI
jgi:hypothetical protein